MFVIRRAKLEDMGTLLKLARTVHFINLPPDSDAEAESRPMDHRAERRQRFPRRDAAKGGADDHRPNGADVTHGTTVNPVVSSAPGRQKNSIRRGNN